MSQTRTFLLLDKHVQDVSLYWTHWWSSETSRERSFIETFLFHLMNCFSCCWMLFKADKWLRCWHQLWVQVWCEQEHTVCVMGFNAVRRQQNNRNVQNEADGGDERRAGSLSRLIQVVLWRDDTLDSESNERESETGSVRQVEGGKLRVQSLSWVSLFWSSGWSVWT